MSDRIKVLLVEDHPIVRQGLKRVLEEREIEVVGEASDGRGGVRMTGELRPDVVVMDISLPKLNGIEATRKIHREYPGVKVIMLTIHEEEKYIYKSFDAGAHGYLVKKTATESIADAIDEVLRGKTYLGPDLSPRILENYRRMTRSGKKRVDEFSRLTKREREILQLIAEGNTSKQIAEQLFISVKTVENHRANIMSKLEIHETAGLVRYAISIGLVD